MSAKKRTCIGVFSIAWTPRAVKFFFVKSADLVICKSKFLLGVEINLTNRTMEINLTNKTLYNKRGATYPNGTS